MGFAFLCFYSISQKKIDCNSFSDFFYGCSLTFHIPQKRGNVMSLAFSERHNKFSLCHEIFNLKNVELTKI